MSANGGRDVGELWAALKASGAPRRSYGAPLSGLAGLPGVTSSVRVIDKHARPAEARPSFIAQLGQGQQAQQGAQQPSGDHAALLVSWCRYAAAAACRQRRRRVDRQKCAASPSDTAALYRLSHPGLPAARHQRPQRPRPIDAASLGALACATALRWRMAAVWLLPRAGRAGHCLHSLPTHQPYAELCPAGRATACRTAGLSRRVARCAAGGTGRPAAGAAGAPAGRPCREGPGAGGGPAGCRAATPAHPWRAATHAGARPGRVCGHRPADGAFRRAAPGSR